MNVKLKKMSVRVCVFEHIQ